MRAMLRLAAVLTLVSMMPVRAANALDGASLHTYCKAFMDDITKPPEHKSNQAFLCLFYLRGALEMTELYEAVNQLKRVCLPKNMGPEQMVASVMNYLRNNPQTWNQMAAFSVMIAWQTDFPCAAARK